MRAPSRGGGGRRCSALGRSERASRHRALVLSLRLGEVPGRAVVRAALDSDGAEAVAQRKRGRTRGGAPCQLSRHARTGVGASSQATRSSPTLAVATARDAWCIGVRTAVRSVPKETGDEAPGSRLVRRSCGTCSRSFASVDLTGRDRGQSMPSEPEWCLQCDRDLEIDASGERWACRRCQRWGTYAIAPNGWRVRVVESSRRPTPVPELKAGRV